MLRQRFLTVLAAVTGFPSAACAAAEPAGPVDLIVTGALIRTSDPHLPVAEAFAVRDGRFAYVGSAAGALALRGPKSAVLELPGRTVLPGLIDAHLHLTGVGLALQEVDLYGADSFSEVVRRTAEFARTSPETWIEGEGWDQNLWPGKAFPEHGPLSAAISERPAALRRVDGHALLANAKAMELAGITRSTPDPPGGRILRDAAGNPTGVFIDNAMAAIAAKIPPPDHERRLRAVRAAVAECNRFGLTSVAEPGVGDAQLAAYEELLRADRFTLRNYAMLADDAALLARRFATGPQSAVYGGRLWVQAVKMFADGALGSRGAALLQPYSDDPGNLGLLRISQAHVQDVTERALRAGFQCCVHAIGDRANRMVLDAFEAALQRVPAGDYRLRIEHAQVLDPADLPRFAELGAIASMQTSHQISDMAWATDRLGPERVRGAYAWRSLLDSGVEIANGTDAPVEAVDPRRTFHAAIARQNERDEPAGGWHPEQRMTRDEALRSMTVWAARANFQDDVLGSIAPGKFADFVVMDRDWMNVRAEDVMQTKIESTYLAGIEVFDGRTASRQALRPRGERGCACARAGGRLPTG